MTIWAFNRPDSEKVVKFLSKSLKDGIARFGWGYIDTADIKKLAKKSLENMTEEEVEIWKKANFLTNIKKDDWIIQINIPYWGAVTAGQVEEEYNFENNDNEISDFRHFFKLNKKTIVEFERDNPNIHPIISKKLKLQGRYWRIYDKTEFMESIENLKWQTVLPENKINYEIQKIDDLHHRIIELADQGLIEVALMYCRKIVEGILMILQNKENIKTKNSFALNSLRLIESTISERYNIEQTDLFFDNLKYFVQHGNRAIHYNVSEQQLSVSPEEIKEKLSWTINWFKKLITKHKKRAASKDLFFGSQNQALPICLKKIEIENYYSLKEITISDIPVDSQFVVFTGDNGEGKTAILQSIAIAMHGNYDEQANLVLCDNSETSIFIEAKYKDEEPIFNEFKGFNNPFSEIKKIKDLVAYGASRLQLQSSESQDQKKLRQSNVYGIFRTDNILQNIEYWLKIQKFKRRIERIDAVTTALINLMPSITHIEITTKPKSNDYTILYTENDIKLHSEQLSAGNKSILAMVGDMIIRLFDTQPDTIEPKDLIGIVLIDEIETHLHPKWQKIIPKLLSDNFPKIQFFISTHSPVIFLGMTKNSVFYNISKNENNKATIKKLDIDIENVLPNQILTSALFNMENIRNVNNKGIEYLSVETEFEIEDRKEKDELLKKLSTGFKFKLPEK